MIANPTKAGHPILMKSKIKIPRKTIGKTIDIKRVCNLVSIMLKSFDKRFVIFPSDYDFTTKDVIFDIFV